MNQSAVEAFQLLGIPRDSDPDAIAHAYRQLARTVHPDVSADADAAERFANLTDAYRVAIAAPVRQRVMHTGDPALVRWPLLGSQSIQQLPIVAGPVRVLSSSDRAEVQRSHE